MLTRMCMNANDHICIRIDTYVAIKLVFQKAFDVVVKNEPVSPYRYLSTRALASLRIVLLRVRVRKRKYLLCPFGFSLSSLLFSYFFVGLRSRFYLFERNEAKQINNSSSGPRAAVEIAKNNREHYKLRRL